MTEPQLGRLIRDDEQVDRDAIHIAIIPLTAGCDLYPRKQFRLSKADPTVAFGADDYYNTPSEVVGVIDPFLRLPDGKYKIKKGERFWGVLYPNTVTGMRHHWEHPFFDRQPIETATPKVLPTEEPTVKPQWKIGSRIDMQMGIVPDGLTPEQTESYVWILNFCDEWNFDPHQLIDNAVSPAGWRYVVAQGRDLNSRGELGEDHDLFWHHLSVFTGLQFSQEHIDGMGWSCTC